MVIKANMKSMHLLIVTLLALVFLSGAAPASGSSQEGLSGNVVIFGTPQTGSSLIALTDESISYLKGIFNRLGRFRPVENNRLDWAMSIVRERGYEQGDFFKSVSTALKVDMFVLVSLYQRGRTIFAEMRVTPLKGDLQILQKRIRVRSRIFKNIPLKLGRELAYLHNSLPLRAQVISKYPHQLYRLNIGQWSNIEEGKRYAVDHGYLVIVARGRYQSIAEIFGEQRDIGDIVSIPLFPKTGGIIDEIEERISQNAELGYGLSNTLLKGEYPEKRMIEGICIINMGGNVCLPGYGAYLSTHYLGFKDARPDVTGIVLSSSMVALHFAVPEFLTGFRINFFPWESDRDKTGDMQNLQVFLWATVPLTFSVAYMNQLAYQFHKNEILPPFFGDRDAAASAFSLFIPGGGLFYKGYRFGGWCYYFSEMILAGYGVYYYDNGMRGTYALTALGVIKLIELLHAYLIEPSYGFYRLETEREGRVSLRIDNRVYEKENVYTLGVVYSFQ
jgi:hypothetical protein